MGTEQPGQACLNIQPLGQNIRKLRHQKEWSQEDIAKRLDISIPAFSKIETGVTDINLSRLEQIAAVFDISAVELLAFNDPNHLLINSELDLLNRKIIRP
jgi:transcriptional regulator with XRE-family HTH domain